MKRSRRVSGRPDTLVCRVPAGAAGKLIFHRLSVPLAAARGAVAQPVQLTGDLAQTLSLPAPFSHEVQHFRRGPRGVDRGSGPGDRLGGAWAAQLRASRLRCGESVFGTGGDHLALMLCDRRQNVNGPFQS